MGILKQFVRNSASRFGLKIMKYPTSQFRTFPVFDLSVQFLMAVQGPKLQFIQIGANDGSFGDPLRKYILNFPWHGIVVEPQPDVFAKLCGNYDAAKERLTFENVAIAGNASTVAMYRAKSIEPGAEAYASSVVSMDPKVIAKQLHTRQSELEPLSVPCATLDKLVSKHQMSHLDILQIDAEGQDFNVLKTLDLSKTAPLIVQVEHGHLSPQEIDRLVQYLDKGGYRVFYGGYQGDTVALHERFPLV
jgi:FkbM family methyltransferase